MVKKKKKNGGNDPPEIPNNLKGKAKQNCSSKRVYMAPSKASPQEHGVKSPRSFARDINHMLSKTVNF